MIKRIIDKLVCLSRKREKEKNPIEIEITLKNKSDRGIAIKVITTGINKYDLEITDPNIYTDMIEHRECLPEYNKIDDRFDKTITCKFTDMIDNG
jgi:hypothetical protein